MEEDSCPQQTGQALHANSSTRGIALMECVVCKNGKVD